MGTNRFQLSGRERLAVAGAILAIAALALVALGRDRASAAGGATASRTAGVTIAHFAFSPTPLRVAKGTTVKFSNASKIAHTATERGSFNTGRIRPGTSVSIRFTRAGTYAYHCSIHPKMHGKIIVG
jgi:plastocyanin